MKKILSLILCLCLCFVFCACGGNTNETANSGNQSTDAASSTTSQSSNGTDATLTIAFSEETISAFKSDRPYDKNKEDISLILVTGQSNFHPNNGFPREYPYYAAGNSSVEPEAPTVTTAGAVYSSPHLGYITALTSDRDMVNLCDTSRGGNTFGGVSPSFGAQWHALTGTKVVFVQAALGAVGMHEWVPNLADYTCACDNKGEGQMYVRAIENYKKSYEALSKQYNIVYTGYIWNQGEHEDDYNSLQQGCTIHSDLTYYDAYKSMHDGFMSELDLDFGGISMVRNHKGGVNPTGNRVLTIARAAQYKLCSDIDNLFLLSTISEDCTIDMMDPTLTSHYSQATFNLMGKEMADNLAHRLGLTQVLPEYDGMLVYSASGFTIGRFDKNGTLVECAGNDNILRKGNLTDHIVARPAVLGTNLKISYKLSVGGQDVTDTCIDQFGAINWAVLQTTHKVKTVTVECVKQ